MTPSETGPFATSDRPITVDDLRHKAEQVTRMARDEATAAFKQEWATAVVIGTMAIVVAVSFAYFLGTRAGKR